jgi:hypothetical protein
MQFDPEVHLKETLTKLDEVQRGLVVLARNRLGASADDVDRALLYLQIASLLLIQAALSAWEMLLYMGAGHGQQGPAPMPAPAPPTTSAAALSPGQPYREGGEPSR